VQHFKHFIGVNLIKVRDDLIKQQNIRRLRKAARDGGTENIGLPLRLSGLKPDAVQAKMDSVLRALDIFDERSAYPAFLSGGQRPATGRDFGLHIRVAIVSVAMLEDNGQRTLLHPSCCTIPVPH
jgi:hypothetical protein